MPAVPIAGGSYSVNAVRIGKITDSKWQEEGFEFWNAKKDSIELKLTRSGFSRIPMAGLKSRLSFVALFRRVKPRPQCS